MTDAAETRRRKAVLIVEDQALLRRTMRELLQEAFPSHDFLDVADGAGALQACKVYRPGLVLMDKCLPDADGIELTARLKKMYPAIQVVVVSYRSAEAYRQRAIEAGARAYVVKDNLATELIPTVAAIFDALAGPDGGAAS